jgi:glutamate N-acetyltransferase/amino-acid N-acetyltransferase
VIVNSGIANASTGRRGMDDALSMSAALAREVGASDDEILVCSTGTIGNRLPIADLVGAVPGLVSGLGRTPDHAYAAARGIMTSDSVPKEFSVEVDRYTIGGMAKGAGMVRPDMATMLAFLTTDAVVSSETAAAALRQAVDVTFNALNIDGCQSTNDTVLLMCSGRSEVEPDQTAFAGALEAACADLTAQMARDAEGASRVVIIEVSGARDAATARRLGMVMADSALVRSSFYGADPNWGRLVAAMGVAGVDIDVDAIEIAYDGTVLASRGVGVPVDEDALSSRLGGDFTVSVTVGSGPGRATVTTTDLTPDYVRFNGERS